MDYNNLLEILPKLPEKWNVIDVQTWLEFIEMSTYKKNFYDHRIDGCLIMILEEKDLTQELQITKPLDVKKLLIWIQKGLKEYTQLLLQKDENYQKLNLFQKYFYHYIYDFSHGQAKQIEIVHNGRGCFAKAK